MNYPKLKLKFPSLMFMSADQTQIVEWGDISGNIDKQLDLMWNLDQKVDIDKIGNLVLSSIQEDTSNVNTTSIIRHYVNPETGSYSNSSVDLMLQSQTKSGIMPKESFQQIQSNTLKIEDLRDDVTDIQSDVEDLQDEVDLKVDKSDIGNSVISAIWDNTAYNNTTRLVYSKIDPSTGNIITNSLDLALQSQTKSGIMPSQSFNQITKNTEDIAQLQGIGKVYPTSTPLPESLTAQEVLAIYQTVSGQTNPRDNDSLLSTDSTTKNYQWTYYESLDEWIFKGDQEINLQTNTTPGIVQGDNTAGKIFAENDGTMSLVGYDQITADIDNLESDVATNTQDIATNTGKIQTNTQDIATNTGKIQTITSDVEDLKDDVIQNTTDIQTNTGKIQTNTQDIATNTGKIQTITSDVNTINTALNQNVIISEYYEYNPFEKKFESVQEKKNLKTGVILHSYAEIPFADSIFAGVMSVDSYNMLQSNNSDIQTLKSDVDGIETELDGKVDLANVGTSIVTSIVENETYPLTTQLYVYVKNPYTGIEENKYILLTLQSQTKSGIMPRESFNQITKNTEDIAQLQGLGKIYPTSTQLPESLTQQEVLAIFQSVSGETTPKDNDSLMSTDSTTKNYQWTYYESLDEWIFKGDIELSLQTNSTPGIVQGKDAAGFCFAENDGSLSLVGYDQIIQDIDNLESDVATNTNDISTVNSAINKNQISSVSIDNDDKTGVNLQLNSVNIKSGQTSSSKITLPNVDQTRQGIMGLDTYNQVQTNTNNISTLQGDVTTIQGNITDIQTDIEDIESDVTGLKTDVSTLQGDVTTIQTDITTINGYVSTLQGDVSGLKGDVSTLQGDIESIDTTLDQQFVGTAYFTDSDTYTDKIELTNKYVNILTGDESYSYSDILTATQTHQGVMSADLFNNLDTAISDIGDLQTDVDQNTSDIANNSTAISNLQQGIQGKVNLTDIGTSVVTGISESTSYNDTTRLVAQIVNPSTGTLSTVNLDLTLASSTKSGIMPKESFNQITQNTQDIQALQGIGKIYPTVQPLPETLTQAEVLAIFKYVSGETDPRDNDSLLSTDSTTKNYQWTYYESLSEWIFKGDQEIEIQTNSAPGIVQGSNTAGKIFVENDGTMSLVGYEPVPAMISMMYLIDDQNFNMTQTKNQTVSVYSFSTGAAVTVTPATITQNTQTTFTIGMETTTEDFIVKLT